MRKHGISEMQENGIPMDESLKIEKTAQGNDNISVDETPSTVVI